MKLPRLQNLISQQRGRFHHPNIEMLKLTAWKLSANSTLRKGFLDQCQKEQHLVDETVQTKRTITLRIYFGWAKEQQTDPLQASEPQIAEFLEFLFTVKILQARTIAGYKSAKAAVHPGWDGVGVCQTKSLEKLLRAYFIARPTKRRLVRGILDLFYKPCVNTPLNL